MISKLLIANRGEIARRVIRTARRMGVATVAVYSEADAAMPFVIEADEASCIGGATPHDSYLAPQRVLAAAHSTGADAIHPGYGFLSENAAFADAVLAAGLIWVGAPPAAIRAMGLKDAAKRLMQQAGVLVTPGYAGDDQTLGRLQSEAEAIGYPVLIKAVGGGGGKGMRKVVSASHFADALESCRREAAAAFGNNRVLIERYILNPRHIEVQIFGDTHGQIIHLFERDCSLQRRHQKVIEEAPAPGLDASTRAAICDTAVRAAKAIDYSGAGTVEFIADAEGGLRADRIWFMEMNTRLQVEHPVTEAITGQDLVEWQIRVAAGQPLPCRQEDLAINGWAIEARLYAENPATGFLPSVGRLERLRLPDRVRVDSGVEEGGEITPHYDPLIAKLVTHASTRQDAARQLAAAAASVEVWPVKTNAGFLARVLNNPDFVAARINTGFIERHADWLIPADGAPAEVLQAAARDLFSAGAADNSDPWRCLTGFRINGSAETRVCIDVADVIHIVDIDSKTRPARTAEVGSTRVVFNGGEAWPYDVPRAGHARGERAQGDEVVVAPMPGRITIVDVSEGQTVARAQRLLVLEAMKMEHAIVAPRDGICQNLGAAVGQQVAESTMLLRVVEGKN